jgi:hypothetical protein
MHTSAAAHEPWSKRPRFAPRQLLDAERLNAAIDDELERQRLLNLALHGWGVVFGFGVEGPDAGTDRRRAKAGCVLVTCGLALDAFGRMLHTEDRMLSLDELAGPVPSDEGTYTLLVHHAERLDPPVDDACNGTGPQWREYGVVFSLRPGCEPVHDGCPDLTDQCLTRAGYVRRRIGSAEGPPGRSPDLEHACDRPGSLRHTRCGSWCYDPAAGVPIACLELCERGDATCLVIDRVCTDECSPVRHVYRSPLLRELLSCCDVDLPRVDHVSWQEWTDRGGLVPWEEFSARIQVTAESDPGTGFAISFTRAVRVDTLTTASVVLSAITQGKRESDYWMASRVPITLHPLERSGDLALGVLLVADEQWLPAEVTGRSSLDSGFRLEITIRGQLLRDECGHMLNAVPADIGCAPCQGRPGDDLIWAFEVGERGARGYESTREGETT